MSGWTVFGLVLCGLYVLMQAAALLRISAGLKKDANVEMWVRMEFLGGAVVLGLWLAGLL